MNNKIYSYGIGLFRIIALVVMSVITFAAVANAQETGGAITGMPGTENLIGEIRWKKDLDNWFRWLQMGGFYCL